jgi:adiponectin receptor
MTKYLHLNRFEETPNWHQKTFILSGYRNDYSYIMCLKSIFCIHNETMNVWTHLFAAIATFVELKKILDDHYHFPYFHSLQMEISVWLVSNSHILPVHLPVILFLCGALIVFLCSVIFHLFHSHSQEACKTLMCCDYGGICLYIICSAIACNYFGKIIHVSISD